MVLGEFDQHVLGGGALARLRLAGAGRAKMPVQTERVVEDFAELFRGPEIELLARLFEGLLRERVHPPREFAALVRQQSRIHQGAGLFDPRQNGE